LSGKW